VPAWIASSGSSSIAASEVQPPNWIERANRPNFMSSDHAGIGLEIEPLRVRELFAVHESMKSNFK
jgi:hypothetical protein